MGEGVENIPECHRGQGEQNVHASCMCERARDSDFRCSRQRHLGLRKEGRE